MKRFRTLTFLLALVVALSATAWQVSGQTSVVTSSLQVRLSILDRLLVGLSTVTATFEPDYSVLLSHGTGANQATTVWQDDRTLSASGSETLDFNGSLTDAFGNSVTCQAIKALVVKAASGNTNNVLVGGGSTSLTTVFTDTSDQVILRPGGLWVFTAPDATGATVTTSTDDLTFTNSAGSTSVTYDVVLICEE